MSNTNVITLNAMNIYQGFSANSTFKSGYVGYSVSGAGDVNGDGYDDIIIGSPTCNAMMEGDNYYEPPCNLENLAELEISYVIFGDKTMSSPNINLANITNNGFYISISFIDISYFSVSGAGDINGDGYDDLLIGISSEPDNSGIVYTIFGNKTQFLSNITLNNLGYRGFSIEGFESNSYAGTSVDGAGDVNGDGYEDIIFGAWGAQDYAGISYIIYGAPIFPPIIYIQNLTDSTGIMIIGVSPNDVSGWSVSGIGNFNGDIYADIAIGAPQIANPISGGSCSGSGVVYIILGGANLPGTIQLSSISEYGYYLDSSNLCDECGYSVSGAGDFNGDGLDDVVIGVTRTRSPGEGEVFIVYGSSSNLADTDLKYYNGNGGIYIGNGGVGNDDSTAMESCILGASVSSAGYFNEDSYADVIVGAWGCNENTGNSFIIYGGSDIQSITTLPSLSVSQGVILEVVNDEVAAGSGFSVSSVGDINKDGYDDVVIGAPFTDNNSGTSYVVYGTSKGFLTSSPTNKPTDFPTNQPTSAPSGPPTGQPTYPTGRPTVNPSSQPTAEPTGQPTVPTGKPTEQPTGPSAYPTGQPSQYPTVIPTAEPSGQPTIIPTCHPTERPTEQPSSRPTGQPSQYPTVIPTAEPSGNPTSAPTSKPSASRVENVVIDLGTATSVVSSIASFLGLVSLYFGVTRVLNEWGYKYKFIHNSDEAKEFQNSEQNNVIGLYFNQEEDKLVALHKGVQYRLRLNTADSNQKPNGISNELYNIILDQLGVDSELRKSEKLTYKYKYVYGDSQKATLANSEIGLEYSKGKYSPTLSVDLFCKTGKFTAFKLNEYDELINYQIDISNNQKDGISKGLYNTIAKEFITLSSHALLISEENQLRNFLLDDQRIHHDSICGCIPSYQDLGYVQGTIYAVCLGTVRKYQISHEGRVSQESFGRITKVIENTITRHNSKSLDIADPAIALTQIGTSTIADTENPMLQDGSDNQLNNLGALNNKDNSKVLLCIDASMDPDHARLQGEAFLEFGNQLIYITKEAASSHTKLLAIEGDISFSHNIDYSSAALFTQQALEYAPTIRYFFKLLGIDLPQIHLPNEAWAGVHFAAGMVKVGGNSFLGLGQTIESSSYYARLVLYDMLAEKTTDEQPTDLVSFATTCSKHIAVGGMLGLASNAPAYGAINGAAVCLSQHQMLEESAEQTSIRYAVDAVAGIAAVYGLSDQNALAQTIGVVSAVSMSDIVSRVSVATVELGLNGVSGMFEVGDYSCM